MQDFAKHQTTGHPVPCGESNPTVTWLIATHIANHHLKIALQSCFAQTFADFECLVLVNGEAVDQIAGQVRDWFGHDARLRVVTTNIRHLNFSLSLGLHLAKGNLIARMDADDVSLPDRLEKQTAFMKLNPNTAVLGSQYDVIDATGKVLNHVALPTRDKDIRKRLLYANPFCHPSVMFRRDVVLEAGGYLGGLYAEDYDLWARLSQRPDIEFANLSDTCLQYRNVGVGSARGARMAYATMGASQYRNFVAGCGWRWGAAALISLGKALFKARR